MDKNNDNLVSLSYEKLKEGIILGDFAPGEKLQIEKLKAYVGVGPTPIREALSRLTATGLIETALNRGFFVKPVSIEEVRDIYSTFIKIELLAMEQAMNLGDSAWEANIIAALYKLGTIEKSTNADINLHDWLKANHELHFAIIAGCKSPSLLKIREDLYQLFDRYCHLAMSLKKVSFRTNHKDHEALVKAVIARDKLKAIELMTRHLEGSLNLVVEKLKENSNGKK